MQVTVLQHVAPEGLAAIQNALDAKQVGVEVIRVFDGQAVPRPRVGRADRHGRSDGGLRPVGPFAGRAKADRVGHAAESTGAGRMPGQPITGQRVGANVRPSGRQEIGWHPVTVVDDPLWQDIPTTFPALHWHGDIFDLPRCAKSLASSAMTQHQAFRVGDALGLLFHLEVTEEAIAGMARAFPEDLAKVGLGEAELIEHSRARLPALQQIGAKVFSRWVDWLGR